MRSRILKLRRLHNSGGPLTEGRGNNWTKAQCKHEYLRGNLRTDGDETTVRLGPAVSLLMQSTQKEIDGHALNQQCLKLDTANTAEFKSLDI
jgi:hypothetical protein